MRREWQYAVGVVSIEQHFLSDGDGAVYPVRVTKNRI